MNKSNDTGWKNNSPHPCMQQRDFRSNKNLFRSPRYKKIAFQVVLGLIGISGLLYMKFALDSLFTLPSIICGVLIVIGYYGVKDFILRTFNF